MSEHDFTCPDCRLTSHNPNDVYASYCGGCHRFWHELAAGVWRTEPDTGVLHIDIDACLAGNGYEVNEQTRRMLEQTWRQLGEQRDSPTVEIVEHP